MFWTKERNEICLKKTDFFHLSASNMFHIWGQEEGRKKFKIVGGEEFCKEKKQEIWVNEGKRRKYKEESKEKENIAKTNERMKEKEKLKTDRK